MDSDPGKKSTPYLSDPAATREVLTRFGLHARKRYGQNFLISPEIPGRLIDGAGITPKDVVLEIGPGIGTLTQHLACAARHVIAVELDSGLLPVLSETLSGYDNVTVLHQDILDTDIRALAREYSPDRPLQVAANLPYYITTPILLRLLDGRLPISRITVMVQREVAERMAAGPGSKAYGALSLAVQYYSEVEIICDVPPSSFIPRPEVDSCVVSLSLGGESGVPTDTEPGVPANSEPGTSDRADTDTLTPEEEAFLMSVVRDAFGERRKTLANALVSAHIVPDRQSAETALLALGLDVRIRGEALTLRQYIDLSRELVKARI